MSGTGVVGCGVSDAVKRRTVPDTSRPASKTSVAN